MKDKLSELGISKVTDFKAFASEILSIFVIMYISEKLFSVMNVNKTKVHS